MSDDLSETDDYESDDNDYSSDGSSGGSNESSDFKTKSREKDRDLYTKNYKTDNKDQILKSTIDQPLGSLTTEDQKNNEERGSVGSGSISLSDSVLSEDDSTNSNKLCPPDILLEKTEKKAFKMCQRQLNDEAVKEFIKCTVLSRIVHGEIAWQVAKYHILLGSAYFDLKGYAVQAVYHCGVAEAVLNFAQTSLGESVKNSSEFQEMLVEKFHTNANALIEMKKYSEAESSLLKAKQVFESIYKKSSYKDLIKKWEVKLTLDFAKLYMKMKKKKISKEFFEKSLELEIEEHGKNSARLISIYNNLGKVETDDMEKSVGYYLQAHSIATSNFSGRSIEVAETAYATALAFANVYDASAESSAEAYLKESLGIYRSLLGPSHKKTLEVVDELARLYIRTERILEGIKLLESSIPLKDEEFNYYSKKMSGTFKLIASSYMSLGEVENARKSFEKCYAIECAILGSSHKISVDTKKTIDMLSQ